MEWLIIIGYGFSLLVICIFSLGQFNLAWHYRKARKKGVIKKASIDVLPMVTVQLPIYNEKYVVERLIDAICHFDYPKEKLEIQILDDSNDETVEIVGRKVKEFAQQGFDIVHVRRPDRVGYKAGALQYGMEHAKGEFIAIFDADFLPNPDFLKATLPAFHLFRDRHGTDALGTLESRL